MPEAVQTGSLPMLLVERDGSVGRLTLHRPERRNALSLALLNELETALDDMALDARVRTVVIAGAGSQFCSGHDLHELLGQPEADVRDLFTTCSRVMQRLRTLPQPVIARVQGIATAAGCQLVASCDLVVAAEDAQFATPGVKIGLFCTTPMVPLVRAIPPKLAMEMLLTGKPISAAQALAAGLVNRVVRASELDAAVLEYCDAIAATSPMTIRIGKAAYYNQFALDEAAAYAQATEVITRNVQARDAQEGIGAFLAKRTPNWSDT